MVRASRVMVALLALASACGNAPAESRARMPRLVEPKPPPVAPAPTSRTAPPAIDWATASWANDQDVDVLWRSLGIDGDNWQDRVESIPRDLPGLRRAMASFLLRHSRFRCAVETVEDGCGSRQYLQVPRATADIHDSCLQRDIAFWALDQLHESDIDGELYDAFIRIISLPAPEKDLNQRALDKLTPGSWIAENALWEAMAEENDAFVEANLAKLPQDQLARAGREYHIDGALLAIDAANAPTTYLEALWDDQLRPETRITVAKRLVEVHADPDALSRQTRRSIESAVQMFGNVWESDCAAAGIAARLLDDPASVARRRATTADEVAQLACLALHAAGPRGAHWKRLITRHELTVVNHFVDDLHDPPAWQEARTVKPGAFFVLPFADELARALPHCDAGKCPVPNSEVYFELEVRRERNTGLRIHAIHRHGPKHDDC